MMQLRMPFLLCLVLAHCGCQQTSQQTMNTRKNAPPLIQESVATASPFYQKQAIRLSSVLTMVLMDYAARRAVLELTDGSFDMESSGAITSSAAKHFSDNTDLNTSLIDGLRTEYAGNLPVLAEIDRYESVKKAIGALPEMASTVTFIKTDSYPDKDGLRKRIDSLRAFHEANRKGAQNTPESPAAKERTGTLSADLQDLQFAIDQMQKELDNQVQEFNKVKQHQVDEAIGNLRKALAAIDNTVSERSAEGFHDALASSFTKGHKTFAQSTHKGELMLLALVRDFDGPMWTPSTRVVTGDRNVPIRIEKRTEEKTEGNDKAVEVKRFISAFTIEIWKTDAYGEPPSCVYRISGNVITPLPSASLSNVTEGILISKNPTDDYTYTVSFQSDGDYSLKVIEETSGSESRTCLIVDRKGAEGYAFASFRPHQFDLGGEDLQTRGMDWSLRVGGTYSAFEGSEKDISPFVSISGYYEGYPIDEGHEFSFDFFFDARFEEGAVPTDPAEEFALKPSDWIIGEIGVVFWLNESNSGWMLPKGVIRGQGLIYPRFGLISSASYSVDANSGEDDTNDAQSAYRYGLRFAAAPQMFLDVGMGHREGFSNERLEIQVDLPIPYSVNGNGIVPVVQLRYSTRPGGEETRKDDIATVGFYIQKSF